MAIKTFNLDEILYKEFSKHCRKNGISMSKKIENFIREEMERINSFGEIRKQAGRLGNVEALPASKEAGFAKETKTKDKEHSMGKFC